MNTPPRLDATSPTSDNNKIQAIRVTLGVMLCALCVLGNIFNLNMFFGVNFLFGGIFAWIALVFLGPRWAIAATAAGSTYTVFLWGQPVAATVFCGEMLFIVAVSGFKKPTRVPALLVAYWILIGVPVGYLGYRLGVGIPHETVILVLGKQFVNGLLNACIGYIIAYALLLILKRSFLARFSAKKSEKKFYASYANLFQVSILAFVLIPLGVSEFENLQREFNKEIERTLYTTENSILHFENSLHILIAQEAEHLIFHHSKSSWDSANKNHRDFRDLIDLSSGFEVNPSLGQIDFSKLPPEFQELKEVLPKAIAELENGLTILGCSSNKLLSVYRSRSDEHLYFFSALPEKLTAMTFLGYSTNPTLTCERASPLLGSPTEQTTRSFVKHDTAQRSSLRNWLNSTVVGIAYLDSTQPSIIQIETPLKQTVLRIQKDLGEALLRVSVVAIVIVMLSYVIHIFHKRWIERIVEMGEVYLNFRKIDENRLNLFFSEDVQAIQWIKRFAKTVESEEQKARIEVIYRKRAVAEFNQLVEGSSVPVFATDIDEKISFWNASLEKLTGFSRIQVVGKRLSEVAKVLTAKEGQTISDGSEISITTNSGRKIHLQANQTILRDFSQRSKTMGFTNSPHDLDLRFYVAQDITDAVEAQAQIVLMSRLTALGEMASTFAHELNQPLHIISMSAGNTLARVEMGDVPTHYVKEKMGRIQEQALRAGKVIENIRDFVLESGRSETMDFDAVAKCHSAIDLVQEQFRLANIKLNFLTNVKEQTLSGRPVLFEQAILNILNNARQAMDQMPHNQRRCIFEVKKDGCYLEIGIEDSGPGICGDDFKGIFDAFYTTKSDTNGTGIGLYMSRQVIQAMVGDIYAENTPGGGAKITMRFKV